MESKPNDSIKQFTDLMDRVRRGDEAAITQLWNDYYQQLVRIAALRLPSRMRRSGDEEDIALSAFHSFISGVRKEQFPELDEPHNLWGLLITLTGRKVHAHLRHQTRKKRGGGDVRGESVFLAADGETTNDGIGNVPGMSQSADIQAELSEAYELLLEQLNDEQLQQIAVMRMDGNLVDEIAEHLTISKRAVERRLQLIRKIWDESNPKE
ncbi:MAG: ECF-type sigma factor [Rubripirellula sp.]|nr:ECF-type sigma factor [Rubripirellula sp.]